MVGKVKPSEMCVTLPCDSCWLSACERDNENGVEKVCRSRLTSKLKPTAELQNDSRTQRQALAHSHDSFLLSKELICISVSSPVFLFHVSTQHNEKTFAFLLVHHGPKYVNTRIFFENDAENRIGIKTSTRIHCRMIDFVLWNLFYQRKGKRDEKHWKFSLSFCYQFDVEITFQKNFADVFFSWLSLATTDYFWMMGIYASLIDRKKVRWWNGTRIWLILLY